MPKKSGENRTVPFLIFLSAAAVFLYLLRLSWCKWGDLIVDTGREMSAPLRICSGDGLYRDFYYIYGPFSPYFNALLFRIFGVRLFSLVIGGILSAACAAYLAYKIARIFLNRFYSFSTLLTFLVVFAFGQYVYYANYNFILPYSYGAAHSLIFALAALYLFSSGRGMPCAIFLALALLSKIEVGIGAVLAITLSALIFRGSRIKSLLIYTAAPILASAAVYLALGGSPADIWYSVRPNASIPGWLSGAANLKENSVVILKSFVNYIILLVIFIFGGIMVNRVKLPSLRGTSVDYRHCEARSAEAISVFRRLLRSCFGLRLAVARNDRIGLLAMTTAALFILAGCFFAQKFFPFDWQYRPLPLFLLAAIAGALAPGSLPVRQAGKLQALGFNIEKRPAFFCLALFSLLLLSRVLFFVRPAHYGFYLLVPGMIFYYVLFLEVIPQTLPAAVHKTFFKVAFLAVFVLFAAGHFSLSRYCYRNKTLKVSTTQGTLYVFYNSREENCRRLIEYLQSLTRPQETLVVFPEGPMINFLAGRKNPLYYSMYMPLDLARQAVTARVLREMEEYKIDYVVVNQRLGDEQGFPVFGRDYGRPVWEYIKKNYLLLEQFGPFPFTTDDYGIALFKRKK